jgi:hypothetical protein
VFSEAFPSPTTNSRLSQDISLMATDPTVDVKTQEIAHDLKTPEFPGNFCPAALYNSNLNE